MSSQSGANKNDPESPPPRKRSRSCLSVIIVLILLVLAVTFIPHMLLAPPTQSAAPAPIDVEEKEPDEIASLPEGSITRSITQKIIDEADHPLIPLLKVAKEGHAKIEADIRGYTATVESQQRVDGVLGEEKTMQCKLLHGGEKDGIKTALSIYTKFVKPQNLAGQEAIWVDGKNEGKLIAHGSGMLNIKTLYLDPKGPIAMRGNRYPIQMLGMKSLLSQMIEKGKNDLKYDECIAKVKRGILIDGRQCTMMEITHPKPRKHFEYHIARIYIDDERNLPIGYEGYLWPEKEGQDPPLLEKYFYTDIELNPGLSKKDFNHRNPDYNYPRW